MHLESKSIRNGKPCVASSASPCDVKDLKIYLIVKLILQSRQ